MVFSRVPLILADSLLIYITWAKLRSQETLRNIRQPSRRLSLSEILLRSGRSLAIRNINGMADFQNISYRNHIFRVRLSWANEPIWLITDLRDSEF